VKKSDTCFKKSTDDSRDVNKARTGVKAKAKNAKVNLPPFFSITKKNFPGYSSNNNCSKISQ